MSKGKLVKFAEMSSFPNVYQNFEGHGSELLTRNDGAEIVMRGQWAAHFGNDNPITLELACGGGEYAVAMAAMYPDRNFIGIDIKGARIWRGAKQALRANLPNVAFIRTRIEELLYFFAASEINEIWITFPDPFLRKSRANHRLTSGRFLAMYPKILVANAKIHLKTDEPNLYAYTLETIAEANGTILYHDNNIYAKELILPELGIKTYFETIDIARENTVKYIQFTLQPPATV